MSSTNSEARELAPAGPGTAGLTRLDDQNYSSRRVWREALEAAARILEQRADHEAAIAFREVAVRYWETRGEPDKASLHAAALAELVRNRPHAVAGHAWRVMLAGRRA